MAIYTTELLTDRDYNIPEGRLPLEYAVDTANKAKTHSENADVHVTAEEKSAWNAKLDAEALMTEGEVVMDGPNGSEKAFTVGKYAVLAGNFVPGGVLTRLVCGMDCAGELRLEQRASEEDAWRVVGQTGVQQEEAEEIGSSRFSVWVFEGCELSAGQELRIISVDAASGGNAAFIYGTKSFDGCSMHTAQHTDGNGVIHTDHEELGAAVCTRFYVIADVEKYARTEELSEHVVDTTAHVTAAERAAWNDSSSNWTLDRPQLGKNATASSEYTTALGAGARATSGATTAVGHNAKATWGSSTSVGYNATSKGVASVTVGKDASCGENGVAIGTGASTTGWRGSSLGAGVANSGRLSTAIGCNSKCADNGVAVLSVWDFNAVTQTNFYIIGANTPLATTYEDGEACLGYLVKDTSGNVLASGTRKLSELLTNNTTFAPASLDLEAEPPKVFLPTGATDPIEDLELTPDMEQPQEQA